MSLIDTPVVWIPTVELRWHRRSADHKYALDLQQKWVDRDDPAKNCDWRDVPVFEDNTNTTIIQSVKVGGVEYATHIPAGKKRERFKGNAVIQHLIDIGVIDLNQLGVEYRRGCFSQRDYAEFYISLGYSVNGFAELSFFQDMKIEDELE